MEKILKIRNEEFLKNGFNNSKIVGASCYFGAIGFLVTPISILISNDLMTLYYSIFVGVILMLLGVYYLIRYEKEFI